MRIQEKKYHIKSPAKINIGLRILSKRKDGYHNIETIFYPLKIYDDIKISIKKSEPGKRTHITIAASGTLLDKFLQNKKNICYKAVCLFLEKFSIKDNYEIKINIKKNIPVGAGLGGGSSNAASVLNILAKHFKKTLNTYIHSNQTIQKIALELGSDVPFFLYSKPAYATGRGEKLTALPEFRVNYKILIVNPGLHISTKWAYKKLQIKNYEQRQLRIKKSLKKLRTLSISEKNNIVNDFEKAVFKKYPEIEKLKQKMYHEGAVFASLSGSGSTVYGFFAPKKIKAAIRQLADSSMKYTFFES